MNYLFGHDDGLTQLESSFDHLPVDPYTDGGFRFRRYSTFRFENNEIGLQPPETFTQSSKINAFLGDVVRTYPPIEEATYRTPAFRRMFEHFAEHVVIDVGRHIEVHQIRIRKLDGAAMAPEGRHQDGFDRIAVFFIGNENIEGGHLRLSDDPNAPAIIDRALLPGDYAVLNDRTLYHNASPIELVEKDKDGFVDFFVLTSLDDKTRH